MKNLVGAMLLTVAVVGAQPAVAGGIEWPDGAKGALALTYDDSLDSQLDNAVPGLDQYGFRGTFFLTIERIESADEAARWRAVAAKGHELANHALFHPCRGDLPNRDWVQPEADLAQYTIPRLVRELETTNRALALIDGSDGPRTFAYPCGDFTANGESFVDAIAPLFVAARGVSSQTDWISAPPVDMQRVATFGPADIEAPVLIDYVKQVIESGGFGTLTFHGIGGDYLQVSTEAHEELLSFLDQHREELWVDTFLNIATHVRDAQSD